VDLYSKAQANWSEVLKSTCPSEIARGEEFEENTSSALQLQIDAYSSFLESFAKLARSAWTEFNLWLMGIGLLLMILSVITQAYTLVKLNSVCQPSNQKSAGARVIPKLSFAFTLVAIRAVSLLSNSYICEFRYTNVTEHFELTLVSTDSRSCFLVMQCQKV
jgi:phosphatidylinositol glycan class O